MSGLSLTRSLTFRATHRMAWPEWSDEENAKRFGWTSREHGHDYTLSVTVGGTMGPQGLLVDLGQLDTLLESIVAPLRGSSLNDTVEPVAAGRALPSCEAVAAWLYGRIAPELPGGARLERVRVAEDPSLHADCTGPA